MASTTSVQSRSIWESRVFKAKTLNSASGSDRKPTRPAAEASPTILDEIIVRHGQSRRMEEGSWSIVLPLVNEATAERGSFQTGEVSFEIDKRESQDKQI